MSVAPSNDVTRITLMVLVISVLLAGSFWTLLPFIGGAIWAVTIVIATWPLLLRLQRIAGGRRSIAATIMTLIILLVFAVPFALAVTAIVDAAYSSPTIIHDFLERGLGEPPRWIESIPVVGKRITGKWLELAAGGPAALGEAVRPYAKSAAAWAIAASGGLGRTIVLVLLTIVIAAILYVQGETAARGTLAFARRLGGESGENTIRLAGQAVRSVALGVVVTALVQALLAGLGLWICGVPHPGLLTALAFALGIAQLGPAPVLLPAIIWLYWTGNVVWGTVLLIWSVPVVPLDNIMRPIMIRRGVQLPMLLILGGVIGGLISFGVVGLFVGPVILAATYTLTKDWVARGNAVSM